MMHDYVTSLSIDVSAETPEAAARAANWVLIDEPSFDTRVWEVRRDDSHSEAVSFVALPVGPGRPGFADLVEHERHRLAIRNVGSGPVAVQIRCVECDTVLVEVDNPATRDDLTADAADALAARIVEDAAAREPSPPCTPHTKADQREPGFGAFIEQVWNELTEEAPRPLDALAADALDVIERCAELDYVSAQIAAPALSWQMQRLARQVAELAQHAAAQEARS